MIKQDIKTLYNSGLSQREVAKVLDVSIWAVRVALKDAARTKREAAKVWHQRRKGNADRLQQVPG